MVQNEEKKETREIYDLNPLFTLIFKKLKETFREVKKISKIDDESQYQDMLYKYNSKYVKITLWVVIIILWIIMIYKDAQKIINAADWGFDITTYDLISRIIIVTPITISWIVLIPIYITYGLNLVMMTLVIKDFSKDIKIPPGLFDKENACGLKPISQLTMLMSASPLIMAGVVIWNITISGRSIFILQNFLSIIIVMVGMLIIFIFPLLTTHQVMVKEKRKELRKLSTKLESLYERFKEIDSKSNNKEEIDEVHTKINTIGLLHSKIDDMPEWPFDSGIWMQFITLVLLPIIVMVIQIIISEYLR